MKLTLSKALVIGAMLMLCSCRKNQSYSCYLIEDTWGSNETLFVFTEGSINKEKRPKKNCNNHKEHLEYVNSEDEYFSCKCRCSWEYTE